MAPAWDRFDVVGPAFLAILFMVWLAPGEIHRCVDEDGTIQFLDQPCAHEDGEVFKQSAADSDEASLRRWLQQQDNSHQASSDRNRSLIARPTFIVPEVGLTPLPVGSRILATCSTVFFECTNGNAAQMDLCVAGIKTCSTGVRGPCCHSAYISRYQRLRAAGVGRHDAVRVALLGSG